MKKILLLATLITVIGCSSDNIMKGGVAHRTDNITRFADIVDIRNTPVKPYTVRGEFLDQGSWLGYSPPSEEFAVAGFTGPRDVNSCRVYSKSIVTLSDPDDPGAVATEIRSVYYPGSIFMQGAVGNLEFEQDIYFIDAYNAAIKIGTNKRPIEISGVILGDFEDIDVGDGRFIAKIAGNDGVMVTFSKGFDMELTEKGYKAVRSGKKTESYAVVSFFDSPERLEKVKVKADEILVAPEEAIAGAIRRWDGYIEKTLREDTPEKYNRVAVKSVVTLMSNWKAARGDLFHDGIIPSHAVSYFNGFWAWDSWKHAVAVVRYEPELAKDQIRTMFDYQDERGMVIDCIYVDAAENNDRDTKSSLATWAVQAVYDETGDIEFVREMFPKLVKYYNWWFTDRDRDGNSICEFGSTDGTLVAAKWESGMDNAVRFDDTEIYKVNDYAWSFSQESVDLNYYLNYERQGLEELAELLGEELSLPDNSERIRDYFYDTQSAFFYDRDMESGELMTRVQGPEAWTPIWTGAATAEQAAGVLNMIKDPMKFSTYVPFPTCARDAQGFDPRGYWRGAVWLDQAWFAVHGLRNYGYNVEADAYTEQLFERPEGLLEDMPIFENYEPLEGKHAKAPHFSWSAAHLLMLYDEYKR